MTKIGFTLSFILLLAPTLLNGFPFVYYDTGFFLYYANHLFTSADVIFRPLTYSVLLAALHSVFFVVILQCGCLNILMFKTAETLKLSLKGHYIVVLLAIIFTPLAVYSNLVLADIFIAIQALALFNFIYSENNKWWKTFFAFIFAIASMAHYSNMILSLLIMLIALFVKSKRKFIALLLLPLLALPLMHFVAWQKFTVTNSAYFFLFSRFTALNVSQPYLKEKCKTEDLVLCQVVSKGFDPWDSSDKGIIGQAQGGLNKELRAVCLEILKSPSLMLEFAMKSLGNWGRQLILFSKPPENTVDDPIVTNNLEAFNSFDSRMFSIQFFRKIGKETQFSLLQSLSHFYLLNIILSLIIFAIMFRKLSKIQIRFFTFLFCYLVANAFICGVFAEPNDRYQGRLILLLPIYIIYILMDRVILVLEKRLTGRANGPQTMS